MLGARPGTRAGTGSGRLSGFRQEKEPELGERWRLETWTPLRPPRRTAGFREQCFRRQWGSAGIRGGWVLLDRLRRRGRQVWIPGFSKEKRSGGLDSQERSWGDFILKEEGLECQDSCVLRGEELR